MKLLALNVGSSTIKYAVFEGQKELYRGLVDYVELGGKKHPRVLANALDAVLTKILKCGVASSLHEINAVVHRIVHGGMQKKSVIINKRILDEVRAFALLAPLHDIPEIKVVELCQKRFECPQIAVFDTAFHQSMPEQAWRYALPIEWMDAYSVRRFGFHGLSHKYMAMRVPLIVKRKIKRLIACHIGNGVSVTAIKNGVSVDTSMGWTPLEGCVMGTRCGDIDPSIPVLLMGSHGFSKKEMAEALNTRSGLFALCGELDMRRIVKRKDAKARMAVDVFCYRIQKYIGAYAAALGGVDAIAFTGGIGQHCDEVRRRILKDLGFLGITLDREKNKINWQIISRPSSKVKVLVVPCDEERMMMLEALQILPKNV